MPAANSGLAIGGVSYFNESEVLNQTFVLHMNICAKNPALRQAADRYLLVLKADIADNLLQKDSRENDIMNCQSGAIV